VPRFIVVRARADINKFQPLGPPTQSGAEKRVALRKNLEQVYGCYCTEVTSTTPSGATVLQPKFTKVTLTSDAWVRYQEIEKQLNSEAYYSADSEIILPIIGRAIISLLKMASLLAASYCRDTESDELAVTVTDIARAAVYMQRWLPNAIQLGIAADSSMQERQITKALDWIGRNPGKTSAHLQRQMHLDRAVVHAIITTLQDRGEIDTKTNEKGNVALWKIESVLS